MDKQVLVIGSGLSGIKAASGAAQSENVSVKLFTREEEHPDIFLSTDPGFEVFYRHNILRIDTDESKILVKNLVSGEENYVTYDSLIICTGTKIATPTIDDINLKNIYMLSSLQDSIAIIDHLKDNSVNKVAVYGSSTIAIRMLEKLDGINIPITLVESKNHILPEMNDEISDLVKTHLVEKGVEVYTGEEILAFIGNANSEVVEVHTPDHILPTDLVVWTEDKIANSDLAQEACIELSETGAILVDEYMRTNIPNIFAAGSCIGIPHYLTKAFIDSPPNSSMMETGRIAGLNAALDEPKHKYNGTLGTFSLDLFDLLVSKTGLSFNEAKVNGFDPIIAIQSIVETGFSRDLITLMVADKRSRKLLGVQTISGKSNQRIANIASEYLNKDTSIDDIIGDDVIGRASKIMRDKLDGKLNGISPVLLNQMLDDSMLTIVDVRKSSEVMLGTIPNSKNIPLDELNARMNELNKEKHIVLISRDGSASILAYGILKDAGFENLSILDGGIVSYPYELK